MGPLGTWDLDGTKSRKVEGTCLGSLQARAVTVTQPCPGPHLSVEITLPSKPDTLDLRVFTPRQHHAKGAQKSLCSRPLGGGVSERWPHPQSSTLPRPPLVPCTLRSASLRGEAAVPILAWRGLVLTAARQPQPDTPGWNVTLETVCLEGSSRLASQTR